MRKFITGMGIISCRGNSIEEFWNGLINAGGFNPVDYQLPLDIPGLIESRVVRRMDRFSRMTLTSSMLAVEGSNLSENEYNPFRIGTVFNTGYGPLNNNLSYAYKLLSAGVDMVSPTVFAGTVYNAGVGHTCINLQLKGVSTILMGSNSIGYACNLLEQGKADAILAGGVEEYSPELEACFNDMQYIKKDNGTICRPLDRDRNGTRITEGAAVLVLENETAPFYDHSKAMCEVLGYATSFSHINPGRAEDDFDNYAFINAMTMALEESNISTDQIDGIFMAANGGQFGDLAEVRAINSVFGKNAENLPVTSIKGAVGETMGASMSINTLAASLSIKKGMIPPTAGLEFLDSEVELNVVTDQALKGDYHYFMVNGYDVSGCVYSLLIGLI